MCVCTRFCCSVPADNILYKQRLMLFYVCYEWGRATVCVLFRLTRAGSPITSRHISIYRGQSQSNIASSKQNAYWYCCTNTVTSNFSGIKMSNRVAFFFPRYPHSSCSFCRVFDSVSPSVHQFSLIKHPMAVSTVDAETKNVISQAFDHQISISFFFVSTITIRSRCEWAEAAWHSWRPMSIN